MFVLPTLLKDVVDFVSLTDDRHVFLLVDDIAVVVCASSSCKVTALLSWPREICVVDGAASCKPDNEIFELRGVSYYDTSFVDKQQSKYYDERRGAKQGGLQQHHTTSHTTIRPNETN